MITVVTGLPRSGTSMMMRMLHIGGMRVFTDGRAGYETLNAAALPNKTSWLDMCEGRAVKVLKPAVHRLPVGKLYRFIWMDRDPGEQAKSQRKFLNSTGEHIPRAAVVMYRKNIERSIGFHLKSVMCLGPVLRVKFERVLSNPLHECNRVADFCGGLNANEMLRAIIHRRPQSSVQLLEPVIAAVHQEGWV